MAEKRRYRTGKGRVSESPQHALEPGEIDRMSSLAYRWGLPKCGSAGCTRVQGHDERENARDNKSHHPSRQHVRAKFPGAVVIEVWWSS